jgi:hypothetical protein
MLVPRAKGFGPFSASSKPSSAPAEQGGAADKLSTFAEAKVRATFYPKFENEKSDQEVRPLFPLSSGVVELFRCFDRLVTTQVSPE